MKKSEIGPLGCIGSGILLLGVVAYMFVGGETGKEVADKVLPVIGIVLGLGVMWAIGYFFSLLVGKK